GVSEGLRGDRCAVAPLQTRLHLEGVGQTVRTDCRHALRCPRLDRQFRVEDEQTGENSRNRFSRIQVSVDGRIKNLDIGDTADLILEDLLAIWYRGIATRAAVGLTAGEQHCEAACQSQQSGKRRLACAWSHTC